MTRANSGNVQFRRAKAQFKLCERLENKKADNVFITTWG